MYDIKIKKVDVKNMYLLSIDEGRGVVIRDEQIAYINNLFKQVEEVQRFLEILYEN